MKKCPKCGEEYADTTIRCNYCNIVLPQSKSTSNVKKMCPQCGSIYLGKDRCESCGVSLVDYVKTPTLSEVYHAASHVYHENSPGIFLYLLSILIPIAGFIVGVAYISSNHENKGKPLIIASAISFFLQLGITIPIIF